MIRARPAVTTLLAVALGATVAASSPSANADRSAPGDPCLTAPVEGQKLRKDGKLRDARDRFAICSRNACPKEIVPHCMRWGAEVQSAIPSVVLAAHDSRGQDLVDVRVAIDGQPPVDVGTLAIELDPGSHRFVFQRSGSPDVVQQAQIREGEKNREVSAVFAAPAPTPAPTPDTPPAEATRPVPLAAWVLGGVGVVALGSFATFGAMGLSTRSTDHCATGCTQAQKNDVDSKFLVADVSLGVGVVAVGLATWFFLSRPAAESSATSAWIDVRPAPGGAVGTFGARF